MASRIMHYAIATIIADEIHIKDRKKFILGNLEPDISSKQDGSYDLAHFADRNATQQTKGINWVKFIQKYEQSILEDEELLGCLCHLIADACWLKLMREKYLRVYSGEKRKEVTKQGYIEMHRYNSVFVNNYGLSNEVKSISELKMEEVNVAYTEQFLVGLSSDFDISDKEEEQFAVYPYEEVMNYMSYTVKLIKREIDNLKAGEKLSNPEGWYVSI